MKSIPVSKFKATCLAVLEAVRRTGEPILITKRGQALAEVVPAARPPGPKRELGGLASTAQIVGDVVSPVLNEGDWESLRS